MYFETHLDKIIGEKLVEKDQAERAAHQSSGRLSAGRLNDPLQWQVLNALSIGVRQVDEYLLRKFLTGKEMEEWMVGEMDGLIETQKPIEYRGVVGFVDAMVDTTNWNFPLGVIPHEVKSVTNAKFKRLNKMHDADIGHKLQAGLYALATGSDYFAIDYGACDDRRVLTFVYPVSDVKIVIDKLIDEFDDQMQREQIPVFLPRQQWQADVKYNKYPEWSELNQGELDIAMKVHYPTAWEKWRANGSKN